MIVILREAETIFLLNALSVIDKAKLPAVNLYKEMWDVYT